MRLRLLSLVLFALSPISLSASSTELESGGGTVLRSGSVVSSLLGGPEAGPLTGDFLSAPQILTGDDNSADQDQSDKKKKSVTMAALVGTVAIAALIPLSTHGLGPITHGEGTQFYYQDCDGGVPGVAPIYNCDDGESDGLTFDDQGSDDGANAEAVVPEPATWTLTLVGLGLVFLATRRRRLA